MSQHWSFPVAPGDSRAARLPYNPQAALLPPGLVQKSCVVAVELLSHV